MKSTTLADLFYWLGINPFYVVSLLVFLVPLLSFLFFTVVTGFDLLSSVLFTLFVFGGSSLIFYLYFHRNPHREITVDSNVVLSPADGIVVYVKQIKHDEIIESVKKKNHMKLSELLDVTSDQVKNGTGYIIGIELRLFDVHVTRSPISGVKVLDHHVSGRIVPMTHPLFEVINDRETVVLKEEQNSALALQVAIVQIATFITRTVNSFVRDKKQVKQGARLGMIRLGSQVDVVIYSEHVNILVKEHDRVYAGLTKIAEKVNV